MKRPIQYADSLKGFLTNNQPALDWVTDNGQAFGMHSAGSDTLISRALNGKAIASQAADCLNDMHDQMIADPLGWIDMPDDLEDLPKFASMRWWYDTLKPSTPLNTWNLFPKRELSDARFEEAFKLLDQWRDNVEELCRDHVQDRALFAAYWSDHRGAQFEDWRRCDGMLWRAEDFSSAYMPKDFEDVPVRVQPFGMHNILKDAFDAGASKEELVNLAARAFAIRKIEILLPNLSSLTPGYVVPELDAASMRWGQDLVDDAMQSDFADYQDSGAWNGDEWEIELPNKKYGRTEVWRYKWDGQKYQIELVEFCHHVFDKRRLDVEEWRVPTKEEREIAETGVEPIKLRDLDDETRRMHIDRRGQDSWDSMVEGHEREHARDVAERNRKIRECRQEGVCLVYDMRNSRWVKTALVELTLRRHN